MNHSKNQFDFIIITQSDVANYEKYTHLPLEEIGMYSELVFPRMAYHKGAFRSHFDIINDCVHGQFYTESNYQDRRNLLNIWNMPGASGLIVANYLEQFGIKTLVINNFDSEWDLFEEAYTASDSPPPVGISSTFYLSFSETKRISKKCRQLDPSMNIILGGAFANEQLSNSTPEKLASPMRKCGVRFFVHSFNSEPDLLHLIQTIQNNGDFQKVKNLLYFSEPSLSLESFSKTTPQWNNPILNDSPILWNQLNVPSIKRTIQMRTASGCPFSCSFCSYPETAGGHFAMDITLVEKHLENMLSIKGVDRVIFIDDTFNVPTRRFKELLHIFKKYDFSWYSFFRVQYLNEEVAELMKDSGCAGLYLGLESSSDLILKNMNKKAKRSEFLRGMKLLNQYEMTSVAAFIVGYPGETEQTIQENIDFIETAGLDFYCLKEFYYLHHTAIHKQREQYGLTGHGANWSHDTMDYPTAHEHKVNMFKTIKNSVYIDPDTSLWYLAYLNDQGYDMALIKKMQRYINTAMQQQIEGHYDESLEQFTQLKDLFVAH